MVKQQEGETLRAYVRRFNQAILEEMKRMTKSN